MEEKMIALAGFMIISGLFLLERYRRYALEEKIDRLVQELDCFLLRGENNLEETLKEGRVENLRNELAAVTVQAQHQVQYREAREKRLNQFMENMAHQMKTTLTALQIRIDLAQSKASLSDVQTELEECQKCMGRLTGEVDRILECSQLADQKINMWLERCDVSRLIQNTITVLEPLWKKKGVKIVYESSDISGISEIYLDSYWFSQAFENVLKNAVEHTTSGSAVTIQASDRVHRLVLEVKDEGPGIGEDELPYLFERFHRGSYGKTGYGIGLSMAADILKAHHGSIQAENRKDGGACFRLEVPILEGRRPYELQKNN
ncbi:HAMP domain-containing sensor histidine kinase [Lachnospiraceae bacterium 29-91]